MSRAAALFWDTGGELPDDAGYALFSAEHLAILASLAALTVLCLHMYGRMNRKQQNRMCTVTAFLLPVMEGVKLLFLGISGENLLYWLPLHFCSLSIYLYPAAALSHGKRRAALGEIAAVLLLPAAAAALLFPDWTRYSFWNFLSLHSYAWHFLQLLFPLLLLEDGTVLPRVRNAWKSMAFTAAAFVPVYLFDRAENTNYFFVMQPVPGTPLETLWNTFGETFYIPALYGLVCICILGMYLIYGLAGKIRAAKTADRRK
ncbi:MAG: TIGR02206 family membrane protein [Lachnospiraceae bacterium]|jgi:hypothetical integral membrane protein (TIGR02206 family)